MVKKAATSKPKAKATVRKVAPKKEEKQKQESKKEDAVVAENVPVEPVLAPKKEEKREVTVGAESIEGVNLKEMMAPASGKRNVDKIGDDRFDNNNPENTGESVVEKAPSLLDEVRKRGIGNTELPTDIVVTNIWEDREIICDDIFEEEGNLASALSWKPKETKNLTSLGYNLEGLMKSNKLKRLIADGHLVQGRPTSFRRNELFSIEPTKQVLGQPLQEGITHTIVQKADSEYILKYRKRIMEEEAFNNAVGSRDEKELLDRLQ